MGAEFEGKKIVIVGGSAGMGRQTALDVIDRGGSAVIIGRSKGRVDDTVAELTDRRGQAWGIAAELTDRSAVADVQGALSEHHGDATLMVNAAGYFIPKPWPLACAKFQYTMFVRCTANGHCHFWGSSDCGVPRIPTSEPAAIQARSVNASPNCELGAQPNSRELGNEFGNKTRRNCRDGVRRGSMAGMGD